MRNVRRLGAVVATAALSLTTLGVAHADSHLADSTRADALEAMHDEAFAAAQYQAFGEAARASGNQSLATLFEQTAQVEFRDHFTREAKLVQYVQDNVANLQVGIAGESQDLTDYAGWATQAQADRCPAAADLFSEVRRDEAGHLVHYATAAQALVDPESGATVPAPAPVDPVAVERGPAQCAPTTTANLLAAMHGESFAWAKYTLFGDHAKSTGQDALATLFYGSADMELREHFVGEGNLAGTVGWNSVNLRRAIAGETDDIAMYGAAARRAAGAGDHKAAHLFREFRHDEWQHRAAFRDALKALSR